jgi:hypothetical protein
MKVIVTLEIEVDQYAWDRNYGTGHNPSEVRPDVKRYAGEAVREQIASAADADVEVTVR